MSKYQVLAALWFFQCVNYVDRVAIGFAAPVIMKALSIEPKSFGIVLSSFSVGYFIAQIPGGLMADRWGAKLLLVIGPIFWALFTGATGLVAGVAGFVVVRLFFGLAEGMSNAACYKVIGDNFSSPERSRAISIWVTAFAVAPALTGPVIGFLLVSFDWQSVFMMLAVPGLVVALVNYFAIPGNVKKSPDNAAASATGTSVTKSFFRQTLRDPCLWLISVAYFGFSIAYWAYLGWMPTYLSFAHGIDIKSIGLLGGVPYVFGFLGLILSGWLGSSILYRYRAETLGGFYLLAGLSLYFAYTSVTLTSSLVGLSFAAFFLYGSLSNFGAILLDLAPENSRATYSATSNTVGLIGGAIAPIVVGYLVSTSGTFASGFTFMVLALCLSAVCAFVLVPFLSARLALRKVYAVA